MKKYYLAVLDELALSPEADAPLREGGTLLFDKYPTAAEQAVEIYYTNNFAKEPVYEFLLPITEELGISDKVANFIVVACASKRMRDTYRERGYDNALWEDFLEDLRCKLREFNERSQKRGLPGITYWYPLFFNFEMFALGRLEYQRYMRPGMTETVEVGGYTVQPDEMVYFIHIPSRGPLTKELRMDSYRRAYEFFKDELNGKPFVCYCTSWLLYEKNREFMSPDSNIVSFMNDFKIAKSFEVPQINYSAVFNVAYTGDASILPRDTSLRRRLADWLAAGGIPGGGDGYFLFDGETINNA